MVEWTKYNEFTELCDFAARVKVGDMIEISESYLTKNHWCVFYKLNSDDKALFDAEVFHLRPNCSSNGCTHKFRHLVAQKQFRINNKYDDTIKDSRKCPTVCWNKSLYFATTIRQLVARKQMEDETYKGKKKSLQCGERLIK
ncbi:unnamed protein product [Lepeophtheirus salmonis]|uniref:(salmon louse) hypothetical protein n=1 Tax=Lepeophtheirus salmonis TaxID=72036 RepID=A0A7R8CPZ7_LEPSM|nr:unnamed protein product [Lepeophtheirus salmonis]CAF2888398.1 unnamed protein product [Lepeophtheirus salmonis]